VGGKEQKSKSPKGQILSQAQDDIKKQKIDLSHSFEMTTLKKNEILNQVQNDGREVIPRSLGIIVSGVASDSAKASTDKKAMPDRQDDGLKHGFPTRLRLGAFRLRMATPRQARRVAIAMRCYFGFPHAWRASSLVRNRWE
jgi:hypothetical protein